MIKLMDHQTEAIERLGNGKILWGGVGSGKSLTALAYYAKRESPKDIVVITTAKKRDTLDWEREAAKLTISTNKEYTVDGALIVESWNNIGKFEDYEDCFFIFDEQRLVGNGSWVKSFIKIAKRNKWIMLSATPGDNWLDYAPVFIANGFFKNITEFKMKHVLYASYSKYPKIRGYLNERHLEVLRNDILIEMPFIKHTERMLNYIEVGFDRKKFDVVLKNRWNPYKDQPIRDISEVFRLMRRVVNEDTSRLDMIRKLMTCHNRLIIFYTFNYELELLRTLGGCIEIGEWNGHRKNPIPDSERWVYLVQYTAGAEGWNCTSTDAMVLYSLTYSWKNFTQAQGRIDRLDTPFTTLYYYILWANSEIDRAIRDALDSKETFNERKYIAKMLENEPLEIDEC